MKEDLMKMDLNKFIQYFQTNEMLTSLTFEQMIKYYNDYKITNKKLEQLREEFFITQVENKLNNPNTEWEDDQKEYVFNYRKELENYLNKMKEPMEILENKIEKINKEYENKLEKYDKQFDIVSKLKIEIDAKNEVKTGYENILKNFIEFYFPKLYNHLRRTQINIDLFFSKWLLTIFANYFPFDILYQIWDVFIIDKWKALFKFCMIIIFFMKEDMMKMDLNQYCQYFRSNDLLTSLSFEQMIKHYNDYKITNKKLKELRENFFVSQVETKLNNPNTEWEDDQNEYVMNYRKELDNHLKSIQEPMENLIKKI